MPKILPEKECEICGKWFQPNRSNQKYCEDCRQYSSRKRDRMNRNIEHSIRMRGTGQAPVKYDCKCAECGKEFVSWNHPRDFCSNQCASQYRIEHTRCAQCGKLMIDTNDQRDVLGHKWFCSDECKHAHRWQVAKSKGMVKTCPQCHKEFIGNNKYCSEDCYRAYIKEHGVQHKPIPTIRVNCAICGKSFNCRINQTALPICSKACKDRYFQSNKEFREQYIAEQQAAEEAKRKQAREKYIEENGLCSICKTHYKDCERMSSNFRIKPKGAMYKNSKIVSCPKFTE